jgi:hypothetical protein
VFRHLRLQFGWLHEFRTDLCGRGDFAGGTCRATASSFGSALLRRDGSVLTTRTNQGPRRENVLTSRDLVDSMRLMAWNGCKSTCLTV